MHDQTKTALDALARKYQTLLTLRRQRESLEGQGVLRLDGDAGEARRDVARQLAAEFPGCLRELERLTATQIENRLQQIIDTPDALWIAVVLEYHAELRTGLEQRRGGLYESLAGQRLSAQVLEGMAQRRGMAIETVRAMIFGEERE